MCVSNRFSFHAWMNVAARNAGKDGLVNERVTLEDIARRSGVSLTTVSLVLRDKPGINDETRQRVIDMARTLGYRRRTQPDAGTARSLNLVGMVSKTWADEVAPNPFYGPVAAGIEAACRRQQINLLYATVPVDEKARFARAPFRTIETEPRDFSKETGLGWLK